jgi:hypothetical protein
MAARKTHPHLEFAVNDCGGKERIFKRFDEACGFAVSVAASGKPDVSVDVLCWTEGAARFWGGDAAVEAYREDPDASVTERIIIRAESIGRVY